VGTFLQQSGAARTALTIETVAFVVGEFAQAVRRRRDARTADLPGELLFRAVFFAGILLLPIGAAVLPTAIVPGGPWVFALGAVATGAGVLLRWWSFLTLGGYFTVIVKTSTDQPVIDRGPYRILRHPSYTGLLFAFAGAGLMLGNWPGAVGAVALILVGLVFRIGREERALVEALGEPYRTFAAGRARLIPFVW
jgi:protein-S-isoprenylcysteine O-methyltransferase Ste14